MYSSLYFVVACWVGFATRTSHAQPIESDESKSIPSASSSSRPSLPQIASESDYDRWRKGLVTPTWGSPSQASNNKYFHESYVNNHYDARYFVDVLSEEIRQADLRALVQTYLLFTAEAQVQSWLMHGTLLGWHWNRRILPWDSDVDVMLMENDMKFLASYHNMTIHDFDLPINETIDDPEPSPASTSSQIPMRRDASQSREAQKDHRVQKTVSRSYLLDINPAWENGSVNDRANAIDARWIDTETGLYIDLTTLRTDPLHPDSPQLLVKDRHHYLRTDIFPLRQEVFEGVPALVPQASSEVLMEEYGPTCLTRTYFAGHRFDEETRLWVPLYYSYPVYPNRKTVLKGEIPSHEPNMAGEHPH